MADVACVGALIRDERNRVYVHHRTATRRLLPDTWDVVGGHVEAGETPAEALAREVTEETGWRVRAVEAVVADWAWQLDGVTRRELDYLVTVDGDLTAPRLEEGKHDAYAWVGPGDLELMMVGRNDGDRRLRDIVAKAVRLRLTDRLLLTPIGPSDVDDLYLLHQQPDVVAWYGSAWTLAEARRRADEFAAGWETDGVAKWMAYSRADGGLVGRGGASFREVGGRRRYEIGWALHPSRWGNGYATEIGAAALRLVFDDLGAVEAVAYTERHNTRSRAVMERLGMRYVEEIRAPGLVEGLDGVHDDAPFALYAVTREGWRDRVLSDAP